MAKASLFSRARLIASASPLLGFSSVSSHRGKKKGHVCLEKYVGQWNISCTGAKGEEGSGGGEGEAVWSSSALLVTAPHPMCLCRGGGHLAGPLPSLTHFPDRLCSPWRKHRLFLPSSRWDPPQNSARQRPPGPGAPPAPSPCHHALRNRSGQCRDAPRDLVWPCAQTCPEWRGDSRVLAPKAWDSRVAAGTARVCTRQGRKIPCYLSENLN